MRALGKCGGFDSDIIAGMRWAAGLAVAGVPANPTAGARDQHEPRRTGDCTGTTDGERMLTAVIAATGRHRRGGGQRRARGGHPCGLSAGRKKEDVIAVAGLRHVGTKVGFSALGPQVSLSSPGGNCVNITAGSACLYPMLTTSNSGTTTPVANGAHLLGRRQQHQPGHQLRHSSWWRARSR